MVGEEKGGGCVGEMKIKGERRWGGGGRRDSVG